MKTQSNNNILKHTIILALPKIFAFIVGVLRAKLNAVYLGTTGVGIVSQINFASMKVTNFTLLGMNDGLVKQLAEKKDSVEFKSEFGSSLKAYILLITFTTIVSLSLLVWFRDELSNYLFGTRKYINYYYISIFIIPILIFYSYYFAILKSFTASKLISKVQIFTTIISFLLFIPAIIFFHLKGVIIVIILKYIVQLILTAYYTRKFYLKRFNITYDFIYKSRLSKIKLKELTLFANISLGVGVIQIVSDFYSRSILIKELGIDKLGMYTPNIAWGALFVSFIVPSMYTYLSPAFASMKSNLLIVKTLNDSIRIIIFAIIPFLFFGIAFRDLIIPAFYSDDFIGAAKYLPFHFLGVFFIALMETVSQVFTPTGRIKINAKIMVFRLILQLIIAYLLIPIWGLYAYSLTFIVPPFFSLILMYVVLHKEINFIVKKNNVFLFFYSLVISSILYLISLYNQLLTIAFSFIFFSLIWFMLSKNEQHVFFIQITKAVKIFKNSN